MQAKKSLSFLREFPQKTINRGKDYFSRGCVNECKVYQLQGSEFAVTATVSGSYQAPYQVQLYVKVQNGKIQFLDGECSCPVGFECKHLVATLLKVQLILESQTVSNSNKKSNWDDWLNAFKEKTVEEEVATPTEVVVYVIDEISYKHIKVLSIDLKISRILKNGSLGKFQDLSPTSIIWTRNATALDAEILLELKKCQLTQYSLFHLVSKTSGNIFEKILKTERAFWKDKFSSPLKIAEPRYFKPEWKLLNNGYQQLHCEVEGGGKLLPLSPPWYIDPERQECGKLLSQIDLSDLSPLLQAPLIGPNEVEDFQKTLRKISINLPSPKTYLNVKKKIKPKLHLELFGVDKIEKYSWERDTLYSLIFPYFLYEETKLSLSCREPVIYQVNNGKIIEFHRDFSEEMELINIFKKLETILPLKEFYPNKNIDQQYQDCFTFCYPTWDEIGLVAAVMRALKVGKDKGFSFFIDPSFPYHCIPDESVWYLESEGQMNWFDLELGIEVSGKKVNLLPILVALIQDSPELFNLETLDTMDANNDLIIKLSGKQFIQLPLKKIKKVLSTLCELTDPNCLENGKLKLSKIRAGSLLDTADSLECSWNAEDALIKLAKKLQDFKGVLKVSPPKDFAGDLRPYQKEGLNWLQFLSEFGLGGILADDMGLGKTVQALAHICLEKRKTTLPSLVIAPTSLMSNWNQELMRFAPQLKALTLHGPQRKDLFSFIPQQDLIFTTYPLLIRDAEALLKHRYHAVILDEAQNIKNARAKYAKICRSFDSHHRICLTGTPMENHLEELWSLFDFATPGLLGNAKQFKRVFRTPIEKHGSLSLQKNLANRIAPFMLRRTKDLVASELPEKTEIIRTIELEGDQKKLYEGIRLSMHKKVNQALKTRGLASSQILILDALLKLRQVCCDPRLLKLDNAKQVKSSAKFLFLKEMLSKLLEEGRKILLFSSFTSMLKLIEEHLVEVRIPFSKLTGQTKNRKEVISSFQEGKTPLFLISLKAGGTGLNLTAADTVIHYDPWWNPAAENQATDRAYRIGQNKPIFVYKLITKNTVEEKILKLQDKKKALMDQLFSQKQKQTSHLTLEDLENLFEPLDSLTV